MSDYETRSKEQTTTMVFQLGSSPRKLARGEIDERKLTFLVNPEQIPSTLRPALYVLTRCDVVVYKRRFWEAASDNLLTLLDSIGGRGQNNLLRAEAALKGIPTTPEMPPQTPSTWDKIFNRKKAEDFERYEERKEMGLTE